MRTGADNVAVRQEAAVGRRIDLVDRPLGDEAARIQRMEEMLGAGVIARRRGPAEMVEGQAEPPVDLRLPFMLHAAIVRHRQAGGRRRQFGRRPMFVRGANEQGFVTDLPPVAGVDVGRQQRAGEIAEMFGAVDVRQRAGDQSLGHDALLRGHVMG